MVLLHIILSCALAIVAGADYNFGTEKMIFTITKSEWDNMNRELNELKEIKEEMKKQMKEINALKHQVKEINVLKQQVKKIDVLTQQGKEINALKQQVKEIDVLKQQVKEIDVLKQQVKEIDILKQQVKEIDVLKQQVKEIGDLKQQKKYLRQNSFYVNGKTREIQSAGRKTSDTIFLKNVLHNSTKHASDNDKQATSFHIDVAKINKERSYVKRLLNLPTTIVPTPSSLNQVAFCAELSHVLSNLGTHHTIVYDYVITNFGNAYNKNDGIFTAPVEGIYVFTWTTMVKPNVYQGTELVLDGSQVSYSYATSTSGYTSSSKTIILHLQQGNEIWIRTNDETTSGHYLNNGGFNSFVGFLLK